MRVAAFTTHPIQYQVPIWRALARTPEIDLHVYYGSDFSVRDYFDKEFNAKVAWDIPLLDGYHFSFLNVPSRPTPQVNVQSMARAIQMFRPECALLCAYTPLSFFVPAYCTLVAFRIPLIYRGETTDERDARDLWRSLVRRVALPKLYRSFQQICAIGHAAEQHYRQYGVPQRTIVCSPYSVDTEHFARETERWGPLRGTIREALGFISDDVVFLYSGKLVRRKSPQLILDALSVLPESQSRRVGLIFMGDGELAAALKYYLAQRLPNIKARFVGFQNQSTVGRYYAAADCLVLPSRERETWGLVVNEAMQFGLFCIVSDRVGCRTDLVSGPRTGLIFSAENRYDLASCLSHALELFPGRRAETASECTAAVGGYTVAASTEGILSAVRSICKRNRDPACEP